MFLETIINLRKKKIWPYLMIRIKIIRKSQKIHNKLLLNLVNLLQFVIFTASLRVGRLLRHIQALRVLPLVCLLAWRLIIAVVVAVIVFW